MRAAGARECSAVTEVRSILLVGAGPVAIGSGQELATMAALAALALRRAGVRVVAVDSNPNALATELADQGYAEPIEAEAIAAIARQEKVDAILPMFGGRPALEACALLDDSVPILGAPASTRRKALDWTRVYGRTGRRVEVELVRFGTNVVVIGAVEYLAPPSVHVGDSVADVLSPSDAGIAQLAAHAEVLLASLDILGCASVLFSVESSGSPQVLDLRLGSGRASTLLARATGYPVAEAGVFAVIGRPHTGETRNAPRTLRSTPSFSFSSYRGVDTTLGMHMKSFGRALGGEQSTAAPPPGERPRLVFTGGGPICVEQGMEADACVARGVLAAKALGYEVVVIDANPDALAPLLADRAHAAPIYLDEVRAVCTDERPQGIVLQLGGDPPLALAESLEAFGLPLVGTSGASVARATSLVHRDRTEAWLRSAPKLGVECLTDGSRTVLAGVFEYVERAAVHPRDSAAILPPFSLPEETVRAIEEAARAAAQSLGARGLVGVELAFANGAPVILSLRAGAGSALSFATKGTGRDLVALGLRLALGATLEELGLEDELAPAHVAARECSFPFAALPGAEPGLGPAARAIGEAMSVGATLADAYDKALRGVDIRLERPIEGAKKRTVVLVPSEADRSSASDLARRLRTVGFDLSSIAAFDALLVALRIPHATVGEAEIGRALQAGEVSFVIATDDAARTKVMRRQALAHGVPCITTIRLARAVCAAIEESGASARVRPLPRQPTW
jgi:carbamoylphosphate synthase large subunit